MTDASIEFTEDLQELKQVLRDFAVAQGFDSVGFVRPDAVDEAGPRLQEFLAQGRHGTMAWLEEHGTRRSHPNALWAEARSIIVLGMNYGPEGDPLEALARRERGVVSVYAQGKDYHDLVKKRLKRVARALHQAFDCEVKVFVDTAPVMEKPLAAAAGLGWQGKHTNLVSSDFGSWLFLGAIFTTLDLPPDEPHAENCGSCRKCLDICPTKAFPAPFQLDARRCISYLTIEHKGHIPLEFRGSMGNRIYGCDDCLAVCPWNKFAQVSQQQAFHPRTALQAPLLGELAALDDAQFRSYFAGSPVKRTGRDRIVRNVLIAIGNSSEGGLVQVAEDRLRDSSPLVRAMAVWALSRLMSGQEFSSLRAAHRTGETDLDVLKEWDQQAG